MKNSERSHRVAGILKAVQLWKTIVAGAAIAVCFALSSQAGNILSNPDFDQSPGSTGWALKPGQAVQWNWLVNNTLVLSSPNSLWMQGTYGYPVPIPWVSYVYQKIASAPGYTYTADAWFSQFVVEPNPAEGGSAVSGPAGQTYVSGLFGGNMPQYSTNSANTGYYEDGWVEVQFLSSSNTILADYKSFIINPAYVHNLASAGAVTGNADGSTNLNWFNCPVTNQYDPSTIVANGDPDQTDTSLATVLSPGPTNTLPDGIMTAPAGTVYVQFSLNMYQNSYCSGAPHWDNCTLNQLSGSPPSTISDMTPNAGQLFNLAHTNFTFNVSSTLGTTVATNAIQVVENGRDVSSQLRFSGNNTNWNVTLPGLNTNSLYTIAITVNNSAGLVSSANTRFDTFDPNCFVVPAEDYNFNGGSFIQNSIPTNSDVATSYFGKLGIPGADYEIYSGGTIPDPVTGAAGLNLIPDYPDRNTDTAWQVASDPNLPLYIAQNNSNIYNVNISYNNGGNWYMYTRDPYPNGGYYQVYARMSDGGDPTVGGSETLQLVTSGAGTTNFATTNLGYFVLNGATPGWTPDWGTYYWVPLGRDASGLNPTVVSLPPGQQTLQLISGNGCNLIDFVFVPIPALGLPPYINNLNPPILTPGQDVFVSGTPNLTFNVSSLISTIDSNNIHTYFNGVAVPETCSSTNAGTSWTVSVPLPSANQPLVTFSISAVDNNGLSNGVSGTFDTFSQTNLMIEAGDFDFNNGQFIDNPLATATTTASANSYYYYPGGNPANGSVYGVDFTTTNVDITETYLYRVDGNGPGGSPAVGTETNSDFLRDKLINMGPGAQPPFEYVPGEPVPTTNTDFDVAWWPPGTWINYTRTFPSNTYRVYGRLAGGSGAYGVNQTIGPMTMSLVTGGQGTSSQTTQLLGTFSDPNANGFQSWHWIPLQSNGTNVVLTLNGVETLKMTAPTNGPVTGSVNAHFYMFVPYTAAAVAPFTISASVSAGTVLIHIPTGNNGVTYMVQYSGSLNPPDWQTLGSVTGDGTVQTVTDTTGGTQRFYRVVVVQ